MFSFILKKQQSMRNVHNKQTDTPIQELRMCVGAIMGGWELVSFIRTNKYITAINVVCALCTKFTACFYFNIIYEHLHESSLAHNHTNSQQNTWLRCAKLWGCGFRNILKLQFMQVFIFGHKQRSNKTVFITYRILAVMWGKWTIYLSFIYDCTGKHSCTDPVYNHPV